MTVLFLLTVFYLCQRTPAWKDHTNRKMQKYNSTLLQVWTTDSNKLNTFFINGPFNHKPWHSTDFSHRNTKTAARTLWGVLGTRKVLCFHGGGRAECGSQDCPTAPPGSRAAGGWPGLPQPWASGTSLGMGQGWDWGPGWGWNKTYHLSSVSRNQSFCEP